MTTFSLFFLIAGAYLTPKCFSTEVIGGREVTPHSRPFMASLQYAGDHICGGVLIHRQWVLTAAHCRHSFTKASSFKVVLGAHSLAKKEASKQTFRIVRFIPSPGFASKPESNDVMLVKLHTAAKLNSHVQPLQLSPQTDIRAGTKCQVTGWGATNPELLSLSDTLQEVTVTVISRELCNSASYYNHQPIITKGMVCAGDAKGQRDACQGDSGGPLVCRGNFCGLVSGGRKCGDAKKPGVYILLTKKLRTWIKSKLPQRKGERTSAAPSQKQDPGVASSVTDVRALFYRYDTECISSTSVFIQ
ncbi:PREDICTED: granzyme K [Miniopterus natalensis]|uniref:granzyme K n=1 Tax=Miniopterus natalensis TaxID=291302 RepID=UPI0007A71D35|nr:PREDICTED: granzyme K [Miniopterus natalensis]